MLNVVIFSKDRGCQLELLLRSAERYVAEWADVHVSVLYTYSDEAFGHGYRLARQLHPDVRYVSELETGLTFRENVLALVDPLFELTVFFVDDDVFRRSFSVACTELDVLRRDPEIACLSLRLCPRIIYTYTLDQVAPPPPIDGGVFSWAEGEGAWGYPMSLDGHVFRTAELRPLLERLPYVDPNSLESGLAAYPLANSKGLALADAAIVNIPINRVQDTCLNRHGDQPAALLNNRFLAQERIRLEPIAAVENTAVHQEMEFQWEPLRGAASQQEAAQVPQLHSDDPGMSSSAERYFIKEGYRINSVPAYWDDAVDLHGATWQPDVYRDAAAVAARLGCRRIVDVGCGTAGKLAALHPHFEIVGIDFGSNLEVCRQRYPFGMWLEHDLESGDPLPVSGDLLETSVVVCADVIEHLVRPELLLRILRVTLDRAGAVLLSTPDRKLTRGADHMGPPPKPHHVREWALDELAAFLEAEGFEHGDVGLTRSNDLEPGRNTILATVFRDDALARVGLARTDEALAA